MKRAILTIIALMLFSSVALGADWEYYYKDAEGTDWFYDTQSISRGQDTLMVRTKQVLSDSEKATFIKNYPDITDIKKLSYILDRWEINCSKNTGKPLSSFWYSSEDHDVFSVYYSHSQFQELAPNSALAKLITIIGKTGEGGNK